MYIIRELEANLIKKMMIFEVNSKKRTCRFFFTKKHVFSWFFDCVFAFQLHLSDEGNSQALVLAPRLRSAVRLLYST